MKDKPHFGWVVAVNNGKYGYGLLSFLEQNIDHGVIQAYDRKADALKAAKLENLQPDMKPQFRRIVKRVRVIVL